MRRYSNDQGTQNTELFSGLVLKGHLNRLEVPLMQERHIRAQSGSYCNIPYDPLCTTSISINASNRKINHVIHYQLKL